MKKAFINLWLVILFFLLSSQYVCAMEQAADAPASVRAEVLRSLSVQAKEGDSLEGSLLAKSQMVEVKILEGPFKGQVIKAEYTLSPGFNEKHKGTTLEKGDEVRLYIEENEDGTVKDAYVSDIVRDKYLFFLAAAFVLVLLFVGKLKGVKALISLVLTCYGVVKILIPSILKGYDPVMVSVGVCTGIIVITLLLVSGWSKKTLAAIIGTTGGVVTAGIIAQFVGTLAKLTGMGDEQSQMLLYLPQTISFDFRGLLFAGIIIGALGAAMDVGMSIASTMHELHASTPRIKKAELIKAGMNVGRDIMATMSNTLILAYAGSSLQLLLLLMVYNIPFAEIINKDVIASEIVRSLAGSIGLIFTIPLTAFAAGILSKKNTRLRASRR